MLSYCEKLEQNIIGIIQQSKLIPASDYIKQLQCPFYNESLAVQKNLPKTDQIFHPPHLKIFMSLATKILFKQKNPYGSSCWNGKHTCLNIILEIQGHFARCLTSTSFLLAKNLIIFPGILPETILTWTQKLLFRA